MTWEYAALEQRRDLGWCLLKTRSNGDSVNDSVSTRRVHLNVVLYHHVSSSLDLVNMAAADGWEMAGQLPIEFDTYNGRYITCSMMRRRIA